MKVKRAHRQVTFYSCGRSAQTTAGRGNPRGLITHVRGLCIIRLIGLLVFAGTANLCTAAESEGTDPSRGSTTGAIRNPMNPQAYMSQLAGKLNSTDGRGLLLKGVPPQV